MDACRRRGVRIRYGASVESLRAVADPDPSPEPSGHDASTRGGSHASRVNHSQSRGIAAPAAARTAVRANGAGPAAADGADGDTALRWVCGLRDGPEVDPSADLLPPFHSEAPVTPQDQRSLIEASPRPDAALHAPFWKATFHHNLRQPVRACSANRDECMLDSFLNPT